MSGYQNHKRAEIKLRLYLADQVIKTQCAQVSKSQVDLRNHSGQSDSSQVNLNESVHVISQVELTECGEPGCSYVTCVT